MIIKKVRISYNADLIRFTLALISYKKYTFLFCLLVLIIILTACGVYSQPSKFDVRTYYRANTLKNSSEFFDDFPYDRYIETYGIENFQQLEKDRFFFWQTFGDGDSFLYHLEDYFVVKNPIKNIDDAKTRLYVAEKYLDSNRKFEPIENRVKPINEKINEIYIVVGHFLMATTARWLGEQIKNNNLDANSDEIKSLIERMKTQKILVEMPETLAQKVGSRPLVQVFSRASSSVEENRKPLIILIMSLGVLSLVGLIMRKMPKIMVCVLCISIFSLLYLTLSKADNIERETSNSDFANTNVLTSNNQNSDKVIKLLPTHCRTEIPTQLSSYDINLKKNADFFNIINKDTNKELGQLIKMDRHKVKIAYFIKHTSYLTIEQWLAQFQKNAQVILAASGGYSNLLDQPEGLTFEQGNLVNGVLLHDRKALVELKNDELTVANLKNLKLLKVDEQSTSGVEDTFISLSVYSKLLKTLHEEGMTSFQTHLFAYENELKFNPEKTDGKLAERRLLALVKETNGDKYYILINIKTQEKLGVISEDIFNFLKNQGYYVEALLNLDTGKYDILELFDSYGEIYKINNEKVIAGTKDINSATNLLIFYTAK